MALSQARAESVRKHLVDKYQIMADRPRAEGYGDTRPIASDETESGKARNRRVEFKIEP